MAHHRAIPNRVDATMTYALDRAQFERISSLSANARFEEFVSRSTLHQQLWGLRSANGWA